MVVDNRYNQDGLRMVKRDYTKLIAWVIIILITYTIWFKFVPGAIEYIMS